MGLDISHDAFSGSYPVFHRFRNVMALAAGCTLFTEPESQQEFVEMDWSFVTPDLNMGEWEATPADPLLVLIVHSDCEGLIHPEQGLALADRLESLIPAIPWQTNTVSFDWSKVARQFIDGLRRAANAGEDLVFN